MPEDNSTIKFIADPGNVAQVANTTRAEIASVQEAEDRARVSAKLAAVEQAEIDAVLAASKARAAVSSAQWQGHLAAEDAALDQNTLREIANAEATAAAAAAKTVAANSGGLGGLVKEAKTATNAFTGLMGIVSRFSGYIGLAVGALGGLWALLNIQADKHAENVKKSAAAYQELAALIETLKKKTDTSPDGSDPEKRAVSLSAALDGLKEKYNDIYAALYKIEGLSHKEYLARKNEIEKQAAQERADIELAIADNQSTLQTKRDSDRASNARENTRKMQDELQEITLSSIDKINAEEKKKLEALRAAREQEKNADVVKELNQQILLTRNLYAKKRDIERNADAERNKELARNADENARAQTQAQLDAAKQVAEQVNAIMKKAVGNPFGDEQVMYLQQMTTKLSAIAKSLESANRRG